MNSKDLYKNGLEEEKEGKETQEDKSRNSLTKNTTLIIILIVIFVISFATFFVTRSGNSDQIINPVTYQNLSLNSSAADLLPQYSFSYSSLSLPTNFPKDVNIYPNAIVILRQYASTSRSIFVTCESNDTSDQIVNYYKTNLSQNGWGNFTNLVHSAFSAKKGGRTVIITVLPALKTGSTITIEINNV
jgi:hypothetical protein